MFSKSILLIFLFAFVSDGCSFDKRTISYRSNDGSTRSTTIHCNLQTESNITIDPYCDCGSSNFGVVRTIPYNCVTGACGTIHVDLSSACVRCSMCIAVTEEINKTLLEVHDMMASDDWLNDTEVALLLRTICDHSFRHYSLREIDGKRFISDPLPGDKLVTSSADGLWEKNLRNMCHEYLDEIQELQLYKHWREWCEDDEHILNLEDILCRNEISNLRDCRGIDNTYKVPMKTVGVRVKIIADYNNCR